ncbi:hypothetical protein J6590_064252 [Homalodisca vitripennis]|nr:hypothetical protein J6590_064252 [Homalodisca vitripennis]
MVIENPTGVHHSASYPESGEKAKPWKRILENSLIYTRKETFIKNEARFCVERKIVLPLHTVD